MKTDEEKKSWVEKQLLAIWRFTDTGGDDTFFDSQRLGYYLDELMSFEEEELLYAFKAVKQRCEKFPPVAVFVKFAKYCKVSNTINFAYDYYLSSFLEEGMGEIQAKDRANNFCKALKEGIRKLEEDGLDIFE